MKEISELTKNELKDIKLIVFDVDGVLVRRGTKIKQKGKITTLETKIIDKKQIEQIKELCKRGFLINIKNSRIKGFEPKEFIITIHCSEQVKEIENIVSKYKKLYTILNGEAYDIGVRNLQTKALGLKRV